MYKKIPAIVIAVLFTLSTCIYGFAEVSDRPQLELNGTGIKGTAYVSQGDVYLPLRVIAEAMGYQIKWSGKDRTISVLKKEKNILIDLKNDQITANGHTYFMSGDYLGSEPGVNNTIKNTTYMKGSFYSENLGLKVSWDKENNKVMLESKKENTVSIKTIKETSDTSKIRISLQYPQIDGLGDKAAQDKINTVFKKAAMDAKAEGLKNVAELEKDTSGYNGSPNKYETYFNYKVKYNQNSLLSMIFLDYQYTGGAHGMTAQTAYTVNLGTGEEYKLKDLFNSNADYVPFISSNIRAEIDKRVKDGVLYEIQPSVFSSIKSDQDFFLSDDAVVIYFQQYEYFPYAAGIQEFPIGFSALKDMLNSEFGYLNGTTRALYNSKIVYAAEDGLYSVNMEDGKASLLVKGTGIARPVFSRDGSAVAYLKGGDLYAYSLVSTKTLLLQKSTDSYCPGANADFYVSSQKTGITAVNSQTAHSTAVVPAERGTSYLDMRLSPDLKYLAYDSLSFGDDNLYDGGGIWLYDTATGKTRLIVKAQKADGTSMGMIPNMGKWSPDSGRVLIWIKPQSGSLSADGVSAAIYDVSGGKLTELDKEALAYDENVSFASPTGFAMITGGSRMMFENKNISLFDLAGSQSARAIDVPGMVTASPCYSSDGKMLAFTASPAADTHGEYKYQAETISKRQIYLYKDGVRSALTSGDAYRSEAPVFLKNDKYILFARVSVSGEKSIWIMDSDGKNQKRLASWKYSDPNDDRDLNYYGRIDWLGAFTIFDNTKTEQQKVN